VRRGAHEPYAALRHAGYRRYLTGNVLFNTGRQALGVAITWQIYQWTNSATALGPVGLVNVIPLIALVQMLTPDRLRGRVTAFNQLFIGSSMRFPSSARASPPPSSVRSPPRPVAGSARSP
jgi:hypothetical protein